MSKILDQFNKDQLKNVPDVKPGDTVLVYQKIKEGNKDRIQIFEGIVIAKKHGTGISATITVRKVVEGIGVEKVFPLHSPSIEKIEIAKRSKVRRSKLYYLRTAKGKKARLKRKDFSAAIAPEEDTPTTSVPEEGESLVTEDDKEKPAE